MFDDAPADMPLSLFQAEHEEHLDRDHPAQLTSAAAPRPMGSRSVEPFSEGRGIDPGFVVGFLRRSPPGCARRSPWRPDDVLGHGPSDRPGGAPDASRRS